MPTRAELLGLKEEHKRAAINTWVNDLIRYVKHVALTEETSVSYKVIQQNATAQAEVPWQYGKHSTQQYVPLTTPYPMTDVLAYIKDAFPDCIVTYEEVWNEVRPGLKQSSNILTIDWS